MYVEETMLPLSSIPHTGHTIASFAITILLDHVNVTMLNAMQCGKMIIRATNVIPKLIGQSLFQTLNPTLSRQISSHRVER